MSTRKILPVIAIVAIALLSAPALIRIFVLGYNQRPYIAPDVARPALAATPEPTPTPFTAPQRASTSQDPISPGPVVIDYAHFSQFNPANLQSLASALARRGVATRAWLSQVDPFALKSFNEFPDQSKELASQLADASGLVVVSPFFLWTPAEIAVVERFVADGGRLLLISDPDVFGDAAVVTNLLAERFGVVFNDDYLYDTVRNDQNYTHFFQGEFADQAADLAGATVAFYGGRSIAGDVKSQVRSANTTLSSLGAGVTNFTTVAIGGMEGRGTAGRVLAMSDMDVFSEPNVVRHDNHRIVEFTADFLAGAQRIDTVADFPSYLGKRVALAYGMEGALDAEMLLVGAQLQRKLEEHGRSLRLTSETVFTLTTPLSGTVVANAPQTEEPEISSTMPEAAQTEDILYLGLYEIAVEKTDLLRVAGVQLVKEIFTPTATALAPTATISVAAPGGQTDAGQKTGEKSPTATPTPSSEHATEQTREGTPAKTTSATPSIAASASVTATQTPTTTIQGGEDVGATAATEEPTATPTAEPSLTPTPTPTPTPVEVVYLVTEGGLRLLANESALVIRHALDSSQQMLGVLGANSSGVNSAVKRLLNNDLSDCITDAKVTVCPVTDGAARTEESDRPRPTPDNTPSSQSDKDSVPPTPNTAAGVLLVDDNARAQPDEASEADAYLQALALAGISPDLWSTRDQSAPNAEQLQRYAWVIWSNAGYTESNIDVSYIDSIFQYLNGGGRLTISSRKPFFGMGVDPPSVLRDVVIDDEAPELVAGLPQSPITLLSESPPVTPLTAPDERDGFVIALRRGPASDNSDAPVVIAATDEEEEESVGARLIVVGMSVGWLPAEVRQSLVKNMADWMLNE